MDEERICAGCGCLIEGDAVAINGEDYCKDCAEEWVQCANCGEWVKQDEARETPDGDYYCESCAEDTLYYCDKCGEVMWENDAVIIADSPYQRRRGNVEYVCRDCAERYAEQCEDCGEWYTDGICAVRGGGYRCEECLEDFCYCDRCGEYVHYDEWDSDEECCCDCAEDSCGLIKQYHDAPPIQYIGQCRKAWRGVWRGVGVELEIDRDESDRKTETETAERLQELAGDAVYFEKDGSLNYGFEIITQPHTEAAFWAMPWKAMLTACKMNGYTSHDSGTCGLHLHLSREMFGTNEKRQGVAISKLIRFYDMYFNEILKISRRTAEQADRWAASYNTVSRAAAEMYGKKKSNAGRYYAINNTNRHTVEIRITRGTLNYATFAACIDFMLTVAHNSRRLSWAKMGNVAEWLKGLKPETIEYLKERKAFKEVL